MWRCRRTARRFQSSCVYSHMSSRDTMSQLWRRLSCCRPARYVDCMGLFIEGVLIRFDMIKLFVLPDDGSWRVHAQGISELLRHRTDPSFAIITSLTSGSSFVRACASFAYVPFFKRSSFVIFVCIAHLQRPMPHVLKCPQKERSLPIRLT